MPSDTISISGKLNVEFLKIASSATETYIAVGMATDKMFSFAERNLNQSKVFKVVIGVHMPTPPDVMEKLWGLKSDGRLTVGIFTERFFHAKMYLFYLKDQWIAFVGSGNLTDGGWRGNEELFVKINDQDNCLALLEQFKTWETKSLPITQEFLTAYAKSFEINKGLENQKRKNIEDLVDKLNEKFNIDNIDFSAQFFKKSDHMAFERSKVSLDDPEVLIERTKVRNKLYRLNDLVSEMLPDHWDIHDHYIPEHIASHVETRNHDQALVRSLWVGYGRSEPALKLYGNFKTTPLYFMRMQFIIHYDSVGFWLMPGKAGAGEVDRNNFADKMKDATYRQLFFKLLTGLGEPYWIDISNDLKSVSFFSSADELWNYTKRDRQQFYFTIGRDYSIGDPKLSVNNIVNTCLEEFTKYYPVYDMILHRL